MKSACKRLSVIILAVIMLISAVTALSIVASAEPSGSDAWTVTLTSRTRDSAATVCRLSGGGTFGDGESVTVTAFPRKGYLFEGWYDASDTSFSTNLSTEQSYTFTVSSDTSLVALFRIAEGSLSHLTVHGSLYVVNNGAVQSDMYTAAYNTGEMMYLSFRDDSKDFLYWVNSNGNILSTEKDFSFRLASDMEITAYYAQTGTENTTAMVIFRNHFKQVLLSRTYASGQPILYPNPPTWSGNVFTGWYIADANGEPTATEATEAAIYAEMAGNNAVIVVPGYVPDGEEYTVNVSYTDGTDELLEGETYVLGTGGSKVFKAPTIGNYIFQYWTLNGTIITYNKSCTVYYSIPGGVADLQAVYGTEAPAAEPTVNIIETLTGMENEKYIVTNTFHYYAPSEYTVMESGFVWSKNGSIYGTSDGADKLKLGASDTKKHVTPYTVNEAIYSFNIRTSNPENVYYVKAYIILRTSDGSQITLYSDMTVAGFGCVHDLVSHEAKEPTCTDVGWNEYVTCTKCDYTTYEEIEALGHDLEHHEAQAATCTEIGWDAYDTCSRCDYTTYEEIEALGHDLEHHEAKEPTCTDIGWNAYDTCSRCDYTTYEEIEALGHDLEHHEAKEPTCTDIGWNAYDTCSRCDYTTYEEIEALGHDFGEWTQTTAPNCTEAGEETRECSRCDAFETRPVDALGHDYVAVVTEPTCTEQGYTTYTCSRCGDNYVDGYVDALGHDFGEWAVTTAPTCTEAGEETRTCSRCDASETRPVDALGHDLVSHEAKAPTCTEI
ncbi:MAG: InlB B-repeat-containing protein, partial [Clostridia bacterium]|nr:InlB B-repeat-containing protein [Clostridia bacterium]